MIGSVEVKRKGTTADYLESYSQQKNIHVCVVCEGKSNSFTTEHMCNTCNRPTVIVSAFSAEVKERKKEKIKVASLQLFSRKPWGDPGFSP